MMENLNIDTNKTHERQYSPEAIIEKSGEVKIVIDYDKTGRGTITIQSPDIRTQYDVENIKTESVRGAQEDNQQETSSSTWKQFKPVEIITTNICGTIRPT